MYVNLCSAKIYSSLDLRSGYYHISPDKESKAKTAFVTPFGKYDFNAIPFGLALGPAYFQQLILMVLQDCSRFAMVYLDDIIILSKNRADHIKHIERIFQKLKTAGFKYRSPSVISLKREIHYFSHLILVHRIKPLPEKKWKVSGIC